MKTLTTPSAADIGKLGGLARARKMSAKRRKEIAKKAAQKRWQKRNA